MKIRDKIVLVFTVLWALTAQGKIEVNIAGVDKTMQKNIKNQLSVLGAETEDNLTLTPEIIEEYRIRGISEIKKSLEPYGYYNSVILSTVTQTNADWVYNYQIQLGKPIIVNSIHINLAGKAERDTELRDSIPPFPLKTGDIFNQRQYEQGKKDILLKIEQAGYINASFSDHRALVDIDTHKVDIHLTLDSGPLYYFGPITFSESDLSDDFLGRYPLFKEGDIYDPEKTLTLQSDLARSDYFSQVNVKAQPDENETRVPILVELEDAKRNQYIVGAGYGTDTGVRGKLGWIKRRVNSHGHRIATTARIAEIYQKAEVDYIIPGEHPQTDFVKISGGYFKDEFSDKPSKLFETQISQEVLWYGWQRKAAISYQHERFEPFFSDEDNKINTHILLPSVTFIQTIRDNVASPTHGRRIEISMRGSVDALFSDVSFFQTYIQVRWLHAFDETLKLLVRTEAGFTFPDNIEKLPLSQRFFAGGDLSLRGYGYRSLPREFDDEGERHPVGGAYLGIVSVELAKVIKKPYAVSTFVDAGNAFRKSHNTVEVGVGVGVEWQTKLGPLKVALAKPLNRNESVWRIHASFGPEI